MARKTDIRLRRSATAGNAPSTSDLNTGEIALNTADGALFYKRSTGGSDSVIVAADARTLTLDYTNQRVGILKSGPLDQLHVTGVIRTQMDGNNSKYIRLFGGNSGNFLDTYGNTLYIRPAGNTALATQLDTAGNLLVAARIGIGTTAPGVNLDIESSTNNAQLELTATDGTDQSFGIFGATGNNSNGAGLYIQDKTASGSPIRLKIDASGNVGIGTTSPSVALHITNTSARIRLQDSDGTNQFTTISQNGGQLQIFARNNTSNGSIQFFGNNGSASSEYARFDQAGKLGIGITSPSEKLHIDGNIILPYGNAYKGVGSTNDEILKMSFTSGVGDILNIAPAGNSATSEIVLKTSTGSSTSERMRITNAGGVGIGTTSPDRQLHVVGSGQTIALKAEATDGNQSSLDLKNSEGEFRLINDGGSLFVYDQTDTAERLRIDTSGNLCINNTSGAAKIDVRTDDGYGLRLESGSGHYFRVAHGGGTEIAGDVTINAGLRVNNNPVILDTNPAATYGVSEALRIDDSANTTDRQLQIFELLNSGARSHRIAFNTNITTTGSAYTYTQGNYGGSSQIEFGNNGEIVFYTVNQQASGSTTAITPIERFRVNNDGDIRFEGGNLFYDASQNALNFIDNVPAQFGAANDLRISHNGTDSLITNHTGNLKFFQNTTDGNIIFENDDGSGGTKQYMRFDGGADVAVFAVNVKVGDDVSLRLGTNEDLRLLHDGSNSIIQTGGSSTGDLFFKQLKDDADIVFQCDDGSGGVTEYFRLDGSQTNTNFAKDIIFGDNKKALFGGSGDLQLYHDGSNSYIKDGGTGNLRIAGQSVDILNPDANEFKARFKDNDAVELYYDNSKKFETTSTGVAITGNTVISGDLTVNGTNTVLNTTTLDVEDLNITVAKGAANSSAANGAGLTIDGAGASLIWDHGNTYLELNQDLFNPGSFIIGTTSTNVGRMYNSSGVMALEAYTSRQISFGNATNGEHVRIDATGNVAIGTNGTLSAKTVINVNGAATQAALLLNNQHGYGSGVGTAATALQFARDNSPTGGQTIIGAQIHSGNENETTSNPQNLIFSTKSGTSPYNLTEAMRISSQQRVGIGTTSPASNLHIKTSVDNALDQGLVIERSINSDRGYINYYGGAFQFRSTVGDPIVFGETDHEHMRIQPDGNVGIDNTSPQEKLTIGSANNQGDIGFHIGGHRLITFGYMPSNSNNATYAGYPAEIRHDPTTGVLRFGIDTVSRTAGNAANLSTVLTISKDSRVGIGTTSPTQKLDVQGTILVNNEVQFVDSAMRIFRSSNDMRFRTGSSDRLTITSTGNVEIGDSSSSPVFTLNKATTGSAKIDFDNAGNIKARIELDSDENLQFKTGGTPTERLEITEAGVIKFNNAYTFPTSDGSAGQVLKTDGSGALTFQNDSGGGGSSSSITDADNDTKIQVEEGTDDDTIRFDTAGTERALFNSNGLNIKNSGGLRIGGTEVISSARNIANVGSISGTQDFLATGNNMKLHAGGTHVLNIDLNRNFYPQTHNSTDIGFSDTLAFRNFHLVGAMTGGATITSGKIEGTTADDNGHILKTDSSAANAADVALQLRNSSSDYNLKFQPRLPAGNMHSQVNADDFGIFTSNSKGISIGNNDKSLVGIHPTEGIELSTNNTRRVTILNDGNVGIGITNPSGYWSQADNLVVGGTGNDGITIKSSTSGNGRLVFTDTASSTAGLNDGGQIHYHHGSDYMSLRTNGSERLRIDSSGNVGIGTITPQGKLDVDGDLRITRNIVSNTVYQMLSLGSDRTINDYGGVNKDYWRLNIATPGASTDGGASAHAYGTLIFSGVTGSNTTYADRMAITAGGNVGIGTNTPGYKLDVGGSVRFAGTASIVGTLQSYSGAFNVKNIAQDQDLNLQVNDGGTNTTALTVQGTTANVGIGTSSPSNKLHVNSGTSDIVALFESSDTTATIELKDPTASSQILNSVGMLILKADPSNASGSTRIGFETDGSERMRIDSSGLLGLGTTSPSTKLDVVGSILSRNVNNASIRINSTSNAYMVIDRSAANRRSALVFSTAASSIMNNPPAPGTIDWAIGVSDSDELAGDKFCIKQGNTDFSGAALVIDSSNRVGIGNTSPSKPLDVQFSGDSGVMIESTDNHASLYIDAHSGYGEYIRFSQAGNNKYWINVDNNGKMLFRPTATGTEGNIITFDSSGQVGIGKTTVKAKLQVEELGIETTNTTTSATTQVTLASINATDFRSARFTIQVTNSTDSTYQTTELLALHDGTTANITEFGTLITGAAAEATFDAAITSGFFRLQATPASTDTMVFKVVSYAITV